MSLTSSIMPVLAVVSERIAALAAQPTAQTAAAIVVAFGAAVPVLIIGLHSYAPGANRGKVSRRLDVVTRVSPYHPSSNTSRDSCVQLHHRRPPPMLSSLLVAAARNRNTSRCRRAAYHARSHAVGRRRRQYARIRVRCRGRSHRVCKHVGAPPVCGTAARWCGPARYRVGCGAAAAAARLHVGPLRRRCVRFCNRCIAAW